MTASRRMPATRPGAVNRPSESGPRWTIASSIGRTASTPASVGRPSSVRLPQSPHAGVQLSAVAAAVQAVQRSAFRAGKQRHAQGDPPRRAMTGQPCRPPATMARGCTTREAQGTWIDANLGATADQRRQPFRSSMPTDQQETGLGHRSTRPSLTAPEAERPQASPARPAARRTLRISTTRQPDRSQQQAQRPEHLECGQVGMLDHHGSSASFSPLSWSPSNPNDASAASSSSDPRKVRVAAVDDPASCRRGNSRYPVRA